MTETISIIPPMPRAKSHCSLRLRPAAGSALHDLLESSLVLAEDVEVLSSEVRRAVLSCTALEELLPQLVECGLLTEYQANRIDAGTTFGLVLGNYRVLDRLGAGGMGVVFRAEHIRMRKQVAIKVLPLGPEQDARLLRRFMSEIRAIARLQHPNIVSAMDAGETSTDPSGTVLHFFVMEYVPGQDLEHYIVSEGPLNPSKACDLMHQIASALAEAHKHNLVHRDIKPSNIQITPEGQAKLLDFGLARHYPTGLTEQGALLGTLDYMAPEQVQDAHTVDIRADIYGLGGVLYWCLTGQAPFPSKGNLMQELTTRMQQQPPSIRAKRPELPQELDDVVQRMMALHVEDRFATPQAVMRALLPFLRADLREHPFDLGSLAPARSNGDIQLATPARQYQILLVDDESSIRNFCKVVLKAEGIHCDEAAGGNAALQMARAKAYDLVILDINMPDLSGQEVCKKLRENPPTANLKVLMASGNANSDTLASMLLAGADDFLTKPFSVLQLQARVKAALRLKDAQDRSETLNRHLMTVNHELETALQSRNSDLADARNALVLALAKLVEHRANETQAHLLRVQLYAVALSEEAARLPNFANYINDSFIEMLACCAPLHDIGKVGLPDHILLKPGRLDGEERMLMQAHTTMGAETLQEVARNHPSAQAFLQMAIDIIRHHHERFDGQGYPDGLQGEAIPLAARLVAIGDVYDALRSRRAYKPALSHSAALQMMMEGAGQQFDPMLMRAFQQASGQFEKIFRENPD
jgi:response regulator RpfG family c-di-GMP phosphodiesterase/serine/threonine protein kinase